MSIQVGDNFKYLGKKPIDDRMLYSTLSEMVSIPETSLYEGCKAYVIATGKEYQYKSGNTVDPNTGKWRSTEVDLSQYYNKSETDNLLSSKVDKVDEMPELTADINGKIYQYVGSDETTYKTGHFYKAIYVVKKSWYWSSSSITGYTLQHIDDIKVGDTFYQDINCTVVWGPVNYIWKSEGVIQVYIVSGYPNTNWTNSSHTIEEDIRWEEVTTSSVDFDELTNRPQESDAINISDLDLPMPAKPTEYPILFDETGTEYKVGLYKRASDGKVKPVWRKDVKETITANSGSTQNIPMNVTNVESVINLLTLYNGSRRINRCDMGENSVNLYVEYDKPTNNVVFNNNNWGTLSGYPILISLFYTKTTDEWKEV